MQKFTLRNLSNPGCFAEGPLSNFILWANRMFALGNFITYHPEAKKIQTLRVYVDSLVVAAVIPTDKTHFNAYLLGVDKNSKEFILNPNPETLWICSNVERGLSDDGWFPFTEDQITVKS